ncbi:hypothetical protein EC9_10380 [Rosistilla ulvae]|uniref:Uncharacterized protein n=1 Tax=Rosistilla ulvae TaxID=1930277 RepID=A0A517LW63_9BACT|nr:hypothetical protein [Rosistilla ulvae]QDS86863.1 hypothetical protein EC9_10380 [Rosistilla ulvae]
MNALKCQHRRGAIAVAMLVCMLIATTLAASTLHSALHSRRETGRMRQLRQTELLLDAGILRAAEKWTRDRTYRGETWRPTNSMPHDGDAVVKIDVSGDAEAPQVHVVASIEPDSNFSARTQRSTRLEFPWPSNRSR